MQSWWYYKWFKEDTFETRRDLKKGYLIVLIQGVIFYTALWIIIWHVPAESLPDKYEDNYGNNFEFSDK